MDPPLYTARIGESHCLVTGVPYDVLVDRIMEFTVRAAVARSVEESRWEDEELRRKGLGAIQLIRDGRAIWADRASFEGELAEARVECVEDRFMVANECDPLLYERLDDDLCSRWEAAGYRTPSLRDNMKKLFTELQRDASDRAADARNGLVDEIMTHRR